jgi:hypothetical protein
MRKTYADYLEQYSVEQCEKFKDEVLDTFNNILPNEQYEEFIDDVASLVNVYEVVKKLTPFQLFWEFGEISMWFSLERICADKKISSRPTLQRRTVEQFDGSSLPPEDAYPQHFSDSYYEEVAKKLKEVVVDYKNGLYTPLGAWWKLTEIEEKVVFDRLAQK